MIYLYSMIFINLYKKVRAKHFVVELLNKKSRAEYTGTSKQLNSAQNRIVEDLRKDGLAFSGLDEIFPNENRLQAVKSFVDKEFANASVGSNKKFLEFLWENHPVLDLESPVVSLALTDRLIQIANEYTSVFTKFTFFSVARTVVLPESSAQGSQRWHRDPSAGDTKMLKMFVYLNDVTELGTGPFNFVKGSHKTGKWGNVFPEKPPEGSYPQEGAVEKSEISSGITPCFGKAGTIVFCDTTGIHKGGYSTKNSREMITLYYVTPGSLQKPNFSFPSNFDEEVKKLPPLAQRTIKKVL